MSAKSHCPSGVEMGFWLAFVKEADFIRRTRDHYAARTIAEHIWHEHAKTWTDTPYLVNNNIIPAVADAYFKMRRCPDFFAFRSSKRAA